MRICEQLLWILASLLALAIVAARRERCFGSKGKGAAAEPEPYEGQYFAPCATKPQPHPRSHEMPLRALSSS